MKTKHTCLNCGKDPEVKSMRNRKDMRPLTLKQQELIKAYTDPLSPTYMNKTKSAMSVYNTKTRQAACALGCRELNKPHVQKSLKDMLDNARFKNLLVKGLEKRLENPEGRFWGQASELYTKILGAYIEKHEIYKGVSPEDREKYEMEFLEKVRRAQADIDSFAVDKPVMLESGATNGNMATYERVSDINEYDGGGAGTGPEVPEGSDVSSS